MKKVYVSEGVLQAFKIVIFGHENASKDDPMLGEFGIDMIDNGGRHHRRPVAVAMADTFKTTHVHGSSVSQLGGTNHDVMHGLWHSVIPYHFQLAIYFLIDIARSVSGFKWSKAIWRYDDMVLSSDLITNLYHFYDSQSKNRTFMRCHFSSR